MKWQSFPKRQGDVHVTFVNGGYLVWEYSDVRRSLWVPVLAPQFASQVAEFLGRGRYRRFEYDGHQPYCGFWRKAKESPVLSPRYGNDERI